MNYKLFQIPMALNLLIFSLFLGGFSFASSMNMTNISPGINEAGNSLYHGIYKHDITLEDGKWSGAPFVEGGSSRATVGLITDFTFTGDVDGNGTVERVVFLWESSGGSGTRVFMAIMGFDRKQIVNLSTHLIGDRVQLRRGRVHQGKIELDVIQTGKRDAACCPTNKVLRIWTMSNNQLVEHKSQSQGTLSIVDLEGVKWTLTNMNWRETLPKEIQISLIVKANKVSGLSGCNRYFANIDTGNTSGEISITQVGSTRMACPEKAMELETRFLNALSNVVKYSFVNGKLALSYKEGDAFSTLLFTAQ